jgi:MoaA/NifB/PqqE/SkfB family radical SAM enzyme
MSKGFSFQLAQNYLKNFFFLMFNGNHTLRPFFFTHYATLRCNFQCSYCPFPKSKTDIEAFEELDTEDTIKLMQIMYRESPYIYFTGGEPLLRRDILALIQASKHIGFRSISINTNMSLMHQKMEILDDITNLVASLDVLEDEKNCRLLGVPSSMVQRTKKNIIECSKLQKEKNFFMTINCVITPDTVDDVRQVMNFCFQHHIRFAPVPAVLADGSFDARLKKSAEYRGLVKDILEAKKRGFPVFGSLKYLDTIYDFKRFECYPTLTPHTYPDGSLFYPCQPLMMVAANLLNAGSYRKALALGKEKFGPLPMCTGKCHKACYIEPSNYLKNPLLLIKERI